MKTKDELNTLKQELKDLSVKLNELSDEDLNDVVGGAVSKELSELFLKIGAVAAPAVGVVMGAQEIEKREIKEDDPLVVSPAAPLQK